MFKLLRRPMAVVCAIIAVVCSASQTANASFARHHEWKMKLTHPLDRILAAEKASSKKCREAEDEIGHLMDVDEKLAKGQNLNADNWRFLRSMASKYLSGDQSRRKPSYIIYHIVPRQLDVIRTHVKNLQTFYNWSKVGNAARKVRGGKPMPDKDFQVIQKEINAKKILLDELRTYHTKFLSP